MLYPVSVHFLSISLEDDILTKNKKPCQQKKWSTGLLSELRLMDLGVAAILTVASHDTIGGRWCSSR